MHSASSQAGNDPKPNFQPYQIVFLEHGCTRLYAEMVQFVESRDLCWVRPLALVSVDVSIEFRNWTDYDRLTIQDLREGSDLMCPAVLFQEALDVEVIPLMTHLHEDSKVKGSIAHQSLHEFIQQIWQARPELFSSEPRKIE
jgi:hypothetical protein